MDDHGAFGAEIGECFGHGLDEGLGVDADELSFGVGGVGERAEEVEDGGEAEGSGVRSWYFTAG